MPLTINPASPARTCDRCGEPWDAHTRQALLCPDEARALPGSSACSGKFYRVPCDHLERLVDLAREMARELGEHDHGTPSYQDAQRYMAETIARVAQVFPPTRTR